MTLPALNIAQLGLLSDIAGAIFLGRALFFNSSDAIAVQGGTYFDANPHLTRALCEQRVDAQFGLPLLSAGFVIQFVATFDNRSSVWISGIGGTLLIQIVVLYFALRSPLTNWLNGKVRRLQDKSG